MLKLKKLRMPMPVTLNDCLLLWQMGYRTEVNDGRIVTVAKEPRKRKRLESRTNTNSIVSLMQWSVKEGQNPSE